MTVGPALFPRCQRLHHSGVPLSLCLSHPHTLSDLDLVATQTRAGIKETGWEVGSSFTL